MDPERQKTEQSGTREHDPAAAPALSAVGAVVKRVRLLKGSAPDDDAIEAVEELLPEGDGFWPYIRNFASLIVLSAGIAAFGLLADSGAVVIGAMLVAPLMTPITAAAAALVTARNRRLVTSVVVIAFGTALAVGVGWLVSMLVGTSVTGPDELPSEVISRTFPGLLDLGIAITAGAAAGYIAPRRSATSALPGVGIAVALVPPLATVGITAQPNVSPLRPALETVVSPKERSVTRDRWLTSLRVNVSGRSFRQSSVRSPSSPLLQPPEPSRGDDHPSCLLRDGIGGPPIWLADIRSMLVRIEQHRAASMCIPRNHGPIDTDDRIEAAS